MSTNVLTTEWRQTSGNGEFSSANSSLTTLSGLQLTTLSGLSLTALLGSYTAMPATEWIQAEITPATEWRPPDGLSDFGSGAISDIVDASGVSLVDPSVIQIVDTGVTEIEIPNSTWTENDGV